MQGLAAYKVPIKNISFALIFLLLTAFSCEPEEKEFVEVWPRLPVSISPPAEFISLGDTLWVNIDFPDTVEDYLTKQYYKIDGFDFYTSLMLLRLIGPTVNQGDQPAAASSFNFYAQIGDIYDIGSLGGKVRFNYADNRYKAKIGLVTKQRGVFSLIFLYRGNDKPFDEFVIDRVKDGKNRHFYNVHLSYIINGSNFNFELYKANCLVDPKFELDPWFEELFGTYTFEVK